MNAIRYSILDSSAELQQVEHLQQVIWGMTPIEILGATTMRWMIHLGGLLIGAWDENQLVGFCIGTPGKRDNKWVFWSDMTGIHPDYQGMGIGYKLKIKQKQWVQEQDYSEIRWTFDPMRRGNATFNFNKLGVISCQYHPSFYGEMKDHINKGLPTDRLEAVWASSDNRSPVPNFATSDGQFIVEYRDNQVVSQLPTVETVYIEIPYNLNSLKSNHLELAIRWQDAVRCAFLECFHKGYCAVDFQKTATDCWYILHKIV